MMSASDLVYCLAGDLDVTPSLIVETIKETPELLATANSYGRGEISYKEILDATSNYF